MKTCVLGKTMSMATGSDVVDIFGIDQLASGLKAGIEGVIHAMSDLYKVNAGSGWGLLVDAKNVFNVVSIVTALCNACICILWPRCSRFLFNTRHGYSMLLLKGSEHILYSKEGVTQGKPLSMLLKQLSKWHQSWCADDSACAGKLQLVRKHLFRTVGAMVVPLHQPVASVVVSHLSKLHGHSHSGCKDIWHCLHLWLNFSPLQSVNRTTLYLDNNNF